MGSYFDNKWHKYGKKYLHQKQEVSVHLKQQVKRYSAIVQ